MNMDTDAVKAESLFRPVKRRKFLRRRPDPATEDELPTANDDSHDSSVPPPSRPDTDEDNQIAEVVRLRRPHRARKGGIEFSTTSRAAKNVNEGAVEKTAEDVDNDRIQAMTSRFTAHTGQTVDVDKHMMAYIDNEMAKRYRRDGPKETVDTETSTKDQASGQSTSNLPPREPASLGKLHEIDLGQETRLQNIARTEAATRRMAGVEYEPPVEEGVTAKTGPPTGKDGKPWRHRKRRNSEDVQRDRLVEEVLRESKLDVYDDPDEEEARDDDMAADDRIAEQFRRDFIDAIQSRRRVARAKANTTANAKQEAPRGPKLGGSRSARAAMREMQEKGQK